MHASRSHTVTCNILPHTCFQYASHAVAQGGILITGWQPVKTCFSKAVFVTFWHQVEVIHSYWKPLEPDKSKQKCLEQKSTILAFSEQVITRLPGKQITNIYFMARRVFAKS